MAFKNYIESLYKVEPVATALMFKAQNNGAY